VGAPPNLRCISISAESERATKQLCSALSSNLTAGPGLLPGKSRLQVEDNLGEAQAALFLLNDSFHRNLEV